MQSDFQGMPDGPVQKFADLVRQLPHPDALLLPRLYHPDSVRIVLVYFSPSEAVARLAARVTLSHSLYIGCRSLWFVNA